MSNFERKDPTPAGIYKITLAVLFCLLIFQYLYNRSLWNDEAMLSLNIMNRDFGGLLHPLDDRQVAPILFLWIEKGLIMLFGNSEPALRLFPLLCALASLPLFYALCLRLTRHRSLSLCAMVLLGCSIPFVYYSSEVKQYSGDVLVLLAIYCTALTDSAFLTRWRGVALSVAGGIAIFLSNTSVIALCTIGLMQLYQAWRTRKLLPENWLPGMIWALCFAVNYFLFIKDHPHAQYMKAFWKNAFMPLNIFSTPFHKWMDKSVVQVFRDLLPSLPWGYWFIATIMLYASGLFLMIRRKEWTLIYLCLAPVAIHLVLSAMHAYPFELRLILYQSPLYIIVLAYAIWHFSGIFSRRTVAVVAVTGLLSCKLFLQYPVVHDEIRPTIRFINQNSLPGESLYVFRGSGPATRYYIQTRVAEFDSLNKIWGGHRKNSIASYLQELTAVRGRTWLLVSHIYPFNGSMEEENKLVQVLQTRGTLLRKHLAHGASAYEFDLH